MKIIKLLKIALLSVITSLSVSVGTAYEQGLSDFDVMQVAEAFASLDNHEQLMLLEVINQWDDYTTGKILIEVFKEMVKGEVANQFIERGKDVVESVKREYDSYQTESRERAERENARADMERGDKAEKMENFFRTC